MARTVKTSTQINLTLTLEVTETGKYPQARVFDTTGTILSTINLNEIDSENYPGVYRGLYTTPSATKDLYVIYRVFTDAGRTELDPDVESNASDELFVTPMETASGSGLYTHTDTILNATTNLPVEGADIYIFTDPARTNLVASTVTKSNGEYREILYSDIQGDHYRRIVSVGNPVFEDTVTFN